MFFIVFHFFFNIFIFLIVSINFLSNFDQMFLQSQHQTARTGRRAPNARRVTEARSTKGKPGEAVRSARARQSQGQSQGGRNLGRIRNAMECYGMLTLEIMIDDQSNM